MHEDKTDDHQELIHQEATPKTTKQEVDTSTKEKLDSSEDIKPMVCILVMACTNNCTKWIPLQFGVSPTVLVYYHNSI